MTPNYSVSFETKITVFATCSVNFENSFYFRSNKYRRYAMFSTLCRVQDKTCIHIMKNKKHSAFCDVYDKANQTKIG